MWLGSTEKFILTGKNHKGRHVELGLEEKKHKTLISWERKRQLGQRVCWSHRIDSWHHVRQQHAGLDHRKQSRVLWDIKWASRGHGRNARLESLHFIPCARGKAFNQGSGMITVGLRKMDWSRRESTGSYMQDAGRQGRAEVLVTSYSLKLMRTWTLGVSEKMEGRRDQRNLGKKKEKIYLHLSTPHSWNWVGWGQPKNEWITTWVEPEITGWKDEGKLVSRAKGLTSTLRVACTYMKETENNYSLISSEKRLKLRSEKFRGNIKRISK